MAFRRVLRPFDATMVVIGGIIGSGIFINPRLVAQSSGAGPVRVRVVGPEGGRTSRLQPSVVPAEEVVDTLGAGDVLHGATAAALARGSDIGTGLAENPAAPEVQRLGELRTVAFRCAALDPLGDDVDLGVAELSLVTEVAAAVGRLPRRP
jgi:sugar/nucleoside kinase (ribokinase family)